MKRIFYLLVALWAVCQGLVAKQQVYIIPIQQEIGSTTWVYVQKGFEQARQKQADIVIIDMNTYGGEVTFADSIRTTILNAQMPVYAFINKNAASAGALIAIACDQIFMSSGSSIGAATVVSQSAEAMPDKYQSYMRATMRATAQAQGMVEQIEQGDTISRWKRDPAIAEAMVDPTIVVPGVSDSGRVLTFTTQEAQQHHYCEGEYESIEALLAGELEAGSYEVTIYEPSAMDSLLGFLTHSAFQAILIMIIIGGIYFELQSPGIGFPIIASIVAAALYFAPLYIGGLAMNWEIILFVIGILLLALEILVIPGFGVAGILGVIFVISGLILSLLDNIFFNFTVVAEGSIARSIYTVLAGLALGTALTVWLSTKIGSKGLLRNMALQATQSNADGYIGVPTDLYGLVGQQAICATDLRPSGKVQIDGVLYDALSECGFIDKGTLVRVSHYSSGQLYVGII